MVETVVSSGPVGPTRSPIWALARPASPSTGEVIRANSRFRRRLIDGGLGGLNVGLGAQVGRLRVIEVLAADGPLGDQRGVPLDVHLGLAEVGLGLGQAALGLVERRLQRPRVDVEQIVALVHEVAFVVVVRQEVAGDLGPDLRVNVAVEGADPVPVDGHVALGHRGDQHLGRGLGGHRFRLLAAGRNHGDDRRQRQAAGHRRRQASAGDTGPGAEPWALGMWVTMNAPLMEPLNAAACRSIHYAGPLQPGGRFSIVVVQKLRCFSFPPCERRRQGALLLLLPKVGEGRGEGAHFHPSPQGGRG